MNDNNEAYELAESAAEYAAKLYNGLEKIVASLREDRTKEGLNAFGEAAEGVGWLLNAVAALNNAGSGSFETKEFAGYLGEMNEAAQNQDYVLLADLIEYEILPIIDKWGNGLDEILDIKS